MTSGTGACGRGSLLQTSFKSGQLPSGPAGAAGPAGSIGPKGDTGDTGASFSLTTTLPSGQTETGQYAAWGGSSGGFMGAAVNFRLPLARAIAAGHAHFVIGTAYIPQCPSDRRPLPGELCVYQYSGNAAILGNIYTVENGVYTMDASGATGFQLYFNTTTNIAWSYGDWAITAA